MSERPIADMAEVNPALRTLPKKETQVAFVAMTNVRESGGITETRQVPYGSVKNGFTRFQNGDVLFAKITPCMENGKGAFVNGLAGGIGCGSTEFHVLRAKLGNEPAYVYHLLQWKAVRQKAEVFMSGSAGQQRVPSDFFARCRVYAPRYEAQQRIAAILTGIDTAIEKTEALIAKYQQIKAGLMHDLFTRGVLPNGQLRPPREQAPELYRDGILGWLPCDWPIMPIERCLHGSPKNGYSPRETDKWEGVVALGLGCLTLAGFQPRQLKNAPRMLALNSDALLHNGDFLISRANTPQLVGLCGVYQDLGVPAIYPDLMMRLSLNDRVDRYFLEAQLLHLPTRTRLTALAAGTSSSMAKLNSTTVKRFPIAVPTIDEQLMIRARLTPVERAIRSLLESCSKLQSHKLGLMQDLLTGKVQVKVGAGETAIAG